MVTVKNPILMGFYPDPSICRKGEDYYIVNSSFVYAPGVPIFHSRDLAHWEQIGNILDRPSQLPVAGADISDGIYAPTIRYHDGLFYMITTNVTHGNNFIVTAENPQGPWSEPYYLGDDAPGIDPSLFFDDDDKCYYCGTVRIRRAFAITGTGRFGIQELDLKTMKLVGESMAIWKGAVKGCIWPEGPHIYKIDGYYYLLQQKAEPVRNIVLRWHAVRSCSSGLKAVRAIRFSHTAISVWIIRSSMRDMEIWLMTARETGML